MCDQKHLSIFDFDIQHRCTRSSMRNKYYYNDVQGVHILYSNPIKKFIREYIFLSDIDNLYVQNRSP